MDNIKLGLDVDKSSDEKIKIECNKILMNFADKVNNDKSRYEVKFDIEIDRDLYRKIHSEMCQKYRGTPICVDLNRIGGVGYVFSVSYLEQKVLYDKRLVNALSSLN